MCATHRHHPTSVFYPFPSAPNGSASDVAHLNFQASCKTGTVCSPPLQPARTARTPRSSARDVKVDGHPSFTFFVCPVPRCCVRPTFLHLFLAAVIPGACLQKQPSPPQPGVLLRWWSDCGHPSSGDRLTSTQSLALPSNLQPFRFGIRLTFVTSFVSLGWFPLAAARVHSCSAPCVRPPVSQPALRWASFKR